MTEESPLNILLVEDNEADVKIAIRAFNQVLKQNNLYVVNNGQECVDFVKNQGSYQDTEKHPKPDLILLDISMPVMDGFGVLKTLKEDGHYRAIPIIVLTGSDNEEDVMRSYQGGANSFIQKPVTYEEFVEVLKGFNFYWHTLNKLPGRKK